MRDFDPVLEAEFFRLFEEYYNLETDASKQHDPENYSLERMYPLAELAGRPERRLKVVHIAGTKGKGTTSTFVMSLLNAAGHRAGLFTSPHVSTVRERFQEDGNLVSYERLLEAGRSLVASVRAAGLHPSLFELFTVLALRLFADDGMEYAVMETGIGGRLDATNYVPAPEICIITPVSFDHVALLGNTIEKIASEKAGIIKPGVPVVLSKQPYPQAETVVRERAGALRAQVLFPSRNVPDLLPPGTPVFLRENFASAWAAVSALGLRVDTAKFQMPTLRARFEKIHDDPLVMLDGAHNADSMQKLVDSLRSGFPGTHWCVVLGCVKGKDIHGIVEALAHLPHADFVLVNPRTPKKSALTELEQEVRAARLHVLEVIPDLRELTQLPAGRPLLFTGSFFTATIGGELFHPRA